MRRTPFYGDPGDREMLGPSFKLIAVDEMTDIPPAALELVEQYAEAEAEREHHPDYREKGAAVALGFMPHQGENRRQRLAGVATWTPPEQPQPKEGEPEPPRMPTRRELFEQRQRQRRGTLDPELRRLQREKAKTK
jgi:hypothetical protein